MLLKPVFLNVCRNPHVISSLRALVLHVLDEKINEMGIYIYPPLGFLYLLKTKPPQFMQMFCNLIVLDTSSG